MKSYSSKIEAEKLAKKSNREEDIRECKDPRNLVVNQTYRLERSILLMQKQ